MWGQDSAPVREGLAICLISMMPNPPMNLSAAASVGCRLPAGR
jgi:hypothetical protein